MFTLSHVYAEDGTFAVSVTVTDDEDEHATNSSTVFVENQAPDVSVSALPGSVQTGSSQTVASSFTDAGVQDTHSVVYDWGDGTLASDGAVTESGGSGSATTSHAWTTAGTYTVTVLVADDEGATNSTSTVVEVVAAPVNDTDLKLPDLTTAEEGTAYVDSGAYTDPDGLADVVSGTVDYGPGPAVPLTLNAGSFQLNHVYDDEGTYPVTVTLKDADSLTVSAGYTVTVSNADPAVTSTQGPTTRVKAGHVGHRAVDIQLTPASPTSTR